MSILREPVMDVVIWILMCFGAFLPVAMLIRRWAGEKMRTLLLELCDAAIVLIRWAGLVYLILWLDGLFLADADAAGWRDLAHRMSGPYAIWYWLFIAAYVVVPQLFWVRQIYGSPAARVLGAVFILFMMSFERIVIMLTSFHRDYVPSSWGSSHTWMIILSDPLLGITYGLKVAAFVALLFIIRYNRAQA